MWNRYPRPTEQDQGSPSCAETAEHPSQRPLAVPEQRQKPLIPDLIGAAGAAYRRGSTALPQLSPLSDLKFLTDENIAEIGVQDPIARLECRQRAALLRRGGDDARREHAATGGLGVAERYETNQVASSLHCP